MSYDYRYSQRTTTGNRPGRRSFYAPPPPPSRSGQHHGLFTYWIPLVVAGTFAVGGLAAWIWSERSEHDDDHYPQDKPPRPQTGIGQPYPTQGSQPYPGPPRPPGQQGGPSQYSPGPQQGAGGPPPSQGPPPPGGESASYYDQSQSYRQTTETRETQDEDSSWYGRMSGMMKRTPSPQNFLSSASKQVGAGVAAVGGALGSIVEDQESVGSDHAYGEDETMIETSRTRKQRSSDRRSRRTEEKEGFSDHERWSEEADERQRVGGGIVEQESERRAVDARERGKGKQRKAIAVVVSADTALEIGQDDDDAGYLTEHASILSHLPSQRDSSTTDVFVLIYAPGLKSLPPTDYQPSTSTGATPATTPGSELQSISPRPMPVDSPSRQFDALYSQALALVPSRTQILPFTTKDGYVHILRHLAPALVYISDTLSGEEGEDIAQLKGWVGHTILVAGDEGHGGLADTETETEAEDDRKGGRRADKRRARWYENSSFVGLGKDVEVVDATRVGEDWERRVGGRE